MSETKSAGQLKSIFLSLFKQGYTKKPRTMRNVSCEDLGANFKPPDFTLGFALSNYLEKTIIIIFFFSVGYSWMRARPLSPEVKGKT